MIFHLLVGVASSGSLINLRLLQLQVLKSIMFSRLCIPKIYTQYGYTYKYMSACLGQLRQEKSQQSCKIHQPHPLPLWLFRAKPTTAKWKCTKLKWKIWISLLIAGPLEFAKFLVPGHGDCLSPATPFQALILRFPLHMHTHTHTQRAHPGTGCSPWPSDFHTGLSSCWLHRCLDPSISQFPVPVNTWNSSYVHIEWRHTHTPHYEKFLEAELNKKTGWVGGEVQSTARQVFLMYDRPFFSSFCSLDPCFSFAWCLKLSFPCLWFLLWISSPSTFSWHPTVSCTTLWAVMPLKESCWPTLGVTLRSGGWCFNFATLGTGQLWL